LSVCYLSLVDRVFFKWTFRAVHSSVDRWTVGSELGKVGSKLGKVFGAELGNAVGTALGKELVAFVAAEQPMKRKTIAM
jgi:hypothetical protein